MQSHLFLQFYSFILLTHVMLSDFFFEINNYQMYKKIKLCDGTNILRIYLWLYWDKDPSQCWIPPYSSLWWKYVCNQMFIQCSTIIVSLVYADCCVKCFGKMYFDLSLFSQIFVNVLLGKLWLILFRVSTL